MSSPKKIIKIKRKNTPTNTQKNSKQNSKQNITNEYSSEDNINNEETVDDEETIDNEEPVDNLVLSQFNIITHPKFNNYLLKDINYIKSTTIKEILKTLKLDGDTFKKMESHLNKEIKIS